MQQTLDELLSESPRRLGSGEMGGYNAEDAPSVNDQYTDEAIAQGR